MKDQSKVKEESFQEFFLASVRSTGFWSFITSSVGTVTLVIGGVFFLFTDELHTFGMWLVIAGLVLILLSVAISPKSVASFLIGRKGKYGTNVILMTVAFLFIVSLVNFLFFQNPTRWDVTATRVFTLAPQTAKVLDSLDQSIRANVFIVPAASSVDVVKQSTEDLLNEFERASDQFTYRFIDPELNRKLALNYNVTEYPSVVFESVDTGTLESVVCSGVPGMPGCFNFTEQEFVTGIIIASGSEKKKVYHLTGHKERSITREISTGYIDDEGLDLAFSGLDRDNYFVSPLNLKQEPQIPNDTAVLIISRPQQDLEDEEIRILSNYIKTGGRVLAMLDPGTPRSYIDLFSIWGVTVGDTYVADSVSHVSGNPLTPLIQRTNGQFVDPQGVGITQGLGVAFFPGLTFVTSTKAPEDIPPWISISPLALTTPASWSENSENNAEDIRFDPEEDVLGPYPVAIAVAASGTADESLLHPTAKFVIFGDSDFAKNFFFNNDDNANLFLNSVNWLAEDYDLISIRPKLSQTRRLVVTTREHEFIKWSSWFFPPTIMIILGAFVWWRRR